MLESCLHVYGSLFLSVHACADFLRPCLISDVRCYSLPSDGPAVTNRVDGAAEVLGVHVRRIYELIKILEILSLVTVSLLVRIALLIGFPWFAYLEMLALGQNIEPTCMPEYLVLLMVVWMLL